MPDHRHAELCERNRAWPARPNRALTTNVTHMLNQNADAIDELHAEIARLREANGILEDALQEVGDDYPGSSCQEWCVQQVKAARKALEAHND